MKFDWVDVAKKYVVKTEDTKRRVSIGGIRRLVKLDEDYRLCIPCPRGEIYRYDEEGKVWGVYVNSPGSKKRRAIWARLDKLGCEQVQVGDIEAAWKFGAEKLSQVADIMKVRKRFRRKKK